jgi:predicted Zn-dependent protease
MCSCSPPLDRRRILGLLAGAAAAPLVAGCDEIGGFPIQLVSDDTVQQLGIESWQRIRSKTPVSQSRDLQRAIQVVGQRLLSAAGEDPARWEMIVFARNEPNAFALPGGKIRYYVAAATDTSFSEAAAKAMISFCYQEDADHGGSACRRGVEG